MFIIYFQYPSIFSLRIIKMFSSASSSSSSHLSSNDSSNSTLAPLLHMRRTARSHLATRQHNWTSLLHPPLLGRVVHNRSLLRGKLFTTTPGHDLGCSVHHFRVRVQLLLRSGAFQGRHIRQTVVACPHYAQAATAGATHKPHAGGIDQVLRLVSA